MAPRPKIVTANVSQRALFHVLNEVLTLDQNSGLRLSLKASRYKDIEALIATTPEKAYDLTYMSFDVTTGKYVEQGLLRSEHDSIIALRKFLVFKEAQLLRPFTPSDWLSVTEEEFDEYQGSFFTVEPSTKPGTTTLGKFSLPAFKKETRYFQDPPRHAKVENSPDPKYFRLLPCDVELFPEHPEDEGTVSDTRSESEDDNYLENFLIDEEIHFVADDTATHGTTACESFDPRDPDDDFQGSRSFNENIVPENFCGNTVSDFQGPRDLYTVPVPGSFSDDQTTKIHGTNIMTTIGTMVPQQNRDTCTLPDAPICYDTDQKFRSHGIPTNSTTSLTDYRYPPVVTTNTMHSDIVGGIPTNCSGRQGSRLFPVGSSLLGRPPDHVQHIPSGIHTINCSRQGLPKFPDGPHILGRPPDNRPSSNGIIHSSNHTSSYESYGITIGTYHTLLGRPSDPQFDYHASMRSIHDSKSYPDFNMGNDLCEC